MNCANHSQNPAVAYCRTCGKALCEGCKRPVRGAVYCEDCLASRVEAAPGTPGGPTVGPAGGVVINPDAPNPAIATLLGFIPGVGAMYCGEFMKGLVQILIFAALIAAADRADFFGVLVAFWYFYMVFDSYRTAKAKQLGQTVTDPFGLGFGAATAASGSAAASSSAGQGAPASSSGFAGQDTSWIAQASGNKLPIGAFLLIGVGVLLMLENTGFLRLHMVGAFWPVLLIALGVYLFWRRRQRGVCQCVRCTAACSMGPAVLVTLGVLFLLDQLTWRLGFRNTWPILLVVIGVMGFLRSSGSTEGHIEAGAAAPVVTPPSEGEDTPAKQSEAYRG